MGVDDQRCEGEGHYFANIRPDKVCYCGRMVLRVGEGGRLQVQTRESEYTFAEPRLTLSEWREVQKRQRQENCAALGHSWEVVETMEKPVMLRCDCGIKYTVGDRA